MSEAASRSWDSGTLAAIQGRWKQVANLVEINTSSPVRYVDGHQPLATGGNTYSPRAFKVAGITWGEMSRAGVKVTLDNRDSELSDLMYSEGLTGKVMTLTLMVRQSDTVPWETPFEAFTANIADAHGNAERVTVELSGAAGLKRRGGPREGDIYCRHPYKGARCQYGGAELTCDRTQTTCDSRGNAVHFGGFRWAPQPGAIIQLGPVQPAQVPGNSSSSQWYPDAPFVDLYPGDDYAPTKPYLEKPLPNDLASDPATRGGAEADTRGGVESGTRGG